MLSNIDLKDYTLLPVMESFYTIQGEGCHQGKAAYFIRLAGCDVGCTWCDVKESWDANEHEILSLKDLRKELQSIKAETVVITGGEPTMYNLEPLTAMIHELGKKTHLETSAVYTITGSWDWICISPKRYKKAQPNNLLLANELKVIIAHTNDFRFAQKYAKEVSENCKLYLQPEWSVAEEMLPEIISFVKLHPEFQISIQAHKYMNVP
ncbi:MAG: 7-carboxy-7-deazaguanine synthase QueE [Chitinophagales bacterium]